MKKENFFFLALVLAAAVITGSTIGIISNLDIIVNSSSIVEPSDSEPAQAIVEEKNTADSESNNKLTADSTEMIVLSQKEKEQIVNMLKDLGMDENTDYNEFILDFQESQSLNPTGNLDSKTLDAIIKQVTLQRVADAVKD